MWNDLQLGQLLNSWVYGSTDFARERSELLYFWQMVRASSVWYEKKHNCNNNNNNNNMWPIIKYGIRIKYYFYKINTILLHFIDILFFCSLILFLNIINSATV